MIKWLRLLPLFTALLLLSTFAEAQDITGIWQGYFITEFGDQYKYEVQLGQTKKSSLTGVTYSYLDTRFYGKATLTGNFTGKVKTALVQEIKTVELRMNGSSVACIMKCKLEYVRSGKEEFLEGSYSSVYEKPDESSDIKRGANCGGGKVYLRKVITSDFYVEPFLRRKTLAPQPKDEVVKKNTPPKPLVKKPTPPTVKKTPVAVPPLAQRKPKTPVLVPTEQRKPQGEISINNRPAERKIVVPTTIRDRKNELTKTITVTNREVEISLYDNGEVDGDTVSIYLDNAPVLINQRLSTKPIRYTLKLDDASPEHTLILVAENFGRIPPNTSLMIIQDGNQRHQVSITSTDQKNAMVRFRYQKN